MGQRLTPEQLAEYGSQVEILSRTLILGQLSVVAPNLGKDNPSLQAQEQSSNILSRVNCILVELQTFRFGLLATCLTEKDQQDQLLRVFHQVRFYDEILDSTKKPQKIPDMVNAFKLGRLVAARDVEFHNFELPCGYKLQLKPQAES